MGVLFFRLYKETVPYTGTVVCVCVCVSWGVWTRDSHIFKVWMFGDNVSACLEEHCKIIFEEILFY